MTRVRPQFDEVPPDPGATSASLRALGYTLEAAVADLVDNSIAAGADRVDVRFQWLGDQSWVAIVDNGRGMTEDELVTAMRLGSQHPDEVRRQGDLGRFGFGLKTASFSQSRELTVATAVRSRRAVVRSWDLDHITAAGAWQLRRGAPEGADGILDRIDAPRPGTVVLWRRVDTVVPTGTDLKDRSAERRFLARIDRTATHLGLVFHRFLTGRSPRLTITINGRPVTPRSPAGTDARRLARERLRLDGQVMEVAAVTGTEPPAGSRGEDRLAQGFYVYRDDRMIVAGGWLGFEELQPADRFRNARITVDVPSALDRAWSVDVLKSSAAPPDSLRADLLRIARNARADASSSVARPRAGRLRTAPKKVTPLWNGRRKGRTNQLAVNRTHPLVEALREVGPRAGELVDALLTALEESLPVEQLPLRIGPAPQSTEPASDDLLAAARLLLEAQANVPFETALARVLGSQPFNRFPDLERRLTSERPS